MTSTQPFFHTDDYDDKRGKATVRNKDGKKEESKRGKIQKNNGSKIKQMHIPGQFDPFAAFQLARSDWAASQVQSRVSTLLQDWF